MYAITHQFTVLALDRAEGNLVQIAEWPLRDRYAPVALSEEEVKLLRRTVADPGHRGIPLHDGPLAGYRFVQSDSPTKFHLFKDGFVCAPPKLGKITADRKANGPWETFHLVDQHKVPAFLNVNRQDKDAFAARVKQLVEENAPVRLHFGCGKERFAGFLNIDKHSNFGDPADYFLFDFADMRWPIDDASVDYIYSEDFIEHIPQRTQVGFLAEAFRVLKRGGFNRVSTPCLADSLKRNSDFSKGFDGVYFDEFDKWGHVCLFTRGLITDLAEAIGYRQVYFTAKSHGSSQYAVADNRPYSDRDPVLGNLFADLMK